LTSGKTSLIARRGRSLTSGRKFNADELQLMLLWFLNESPAHGYELIKRFDALSQGYYSPSAGVLYPALAQLEARDLALVESSGKRKNFRISPAGRNQLRQHADDAQRLLAFLKHAAKKMQWKELISESEAAATQATGWLPEFIQARKALQDALLPHSDSGHAEQRRIAGILQRAAQEIRQTTDNHSNSFKEY